MYGFDLCSFHIAYVWCDAFLLCALSRPCAFTPHISLSPPLVHARVDGRQGFFERLLKSDALVEDAKGVCVRSPAFEASLERCTVHPSLRTFPAETCFRNISNSKSAPHSDLQRPHDKTSRDGICSDFSVKLRFGRSGVGGTASDTWIGNYDVFRLSCWRR